MGLYGKYGPLVIRAAILAAFLGGPASACELALMFGIDVSGSINADEWRLQTDGLADALLEPEIAHEIITSQVNLSVFQWSGGVEQDFTLPWRQITDETSLYVFVEEVRRLERRWVFGKTSIVPALEKMRQAFVSGPSCARRVIDFSGDGLDNGEGDLAAARQSVGAAGITINGLAIEPEDIYAFRGYKSLDVYYRENVIVGPGAFVQAAEGYQDYPRAIRKKLLTELVRPSS